MFPRAKSATTEAVMTLHDLIELTADDPEQRTALLRQLGYARQQQPNRPLHQPTLSEWGIGTPELLRRVHVTLASDGQLFGRSTARWEDE